MTNSWRIPSFRVEELRRRVNVLNRRVTRTGGTGLSLDVARESTTGSGESVERWSDVVVTGEVPVVAGWEFVARVEHHETGNIVSCSPGTLVELPNSFRLAPASCSHCSARRNRRDTFVLYKDGDLRQVGRNCLADFLRNGDPEIALRVWSLYASVRGLLNEAAERGYGPSDPRGFSTVYFLACTVAAIRESGWVSKTSAMETGRTPTSQVASLIASTKPRGRTPVAEDFAEAGEVAAWIEGLDTETGNDYLANLRAAVAVGCVERRHEGMVASGVAAYRRELEKAGEAARNAAREASSPSSHVGAVDKRYDFRGLTVTKSLVTRSDWGTSLMLLLEDQAGNGLKCFLRGGDSFDVGDVLGGKATVKSHEEFQGRKVTVLTRCKLQKGLPVQGTLVPTVMAAPKSAPMFEDFDIPF